MKRYVIDGAEKLCTIIKNEAEFNSIYYDERAVILSVAQGAGNCHDAFNDYLATKLVADFFKDEGIKAYYFDVLWKELTGLVQKLAIEEIPTFGVYIRGAEIGRHVGFLNRHQLVDFIKNKYSSVIDFSV